MAPNRSTSSSIPFNPAVLAWARTHARYTPEEAAEKLNVSPDKIRKWESPNREASPTIRQARILADFYKRPFLEFFAREVPSVYEPTLVPDFRLNRDISGPSNDKTVIEIQEWAESQRLNALDLYETNGEDPREFPDSLYATIASDPDEIANLARESISFTIEEQLALKSNQKHLVFKIFRKKIENIGILVLRDSALKECGARGLCIFYEKLPIIVVGSEAPGGAIFTLAHELAHIILKQSAISGSELPRNVSTSQISRIEKWCNQFAGAFLMPEHAIREIVPFHEMMNEVDDTFISELAKKFSVSRHAMLVRLVQLRLVKEEFYWQVKRQQFLQEESEVTGGRAPYYGSRYRTDNGDLYTGLVLEAWSSGRITGHSAGEYMGIKSLRHLFDIRDHFLAE